MKPLTFIYGQDSYRGREKLKDLVSGLKALHKGLLMKEVDMSVPEAIRNLGEEFRQDSLFGHKRLFILRNAFANGALLDYLKTCGDSSAAFMVIYEEGQPGAADNLFRFLKMQADVYHYPRLTGRELADWIIKEAKKCGGDIDRQAAGYLAECFGPDTWALNSQLKKLAALKKRTVINLKDVTGFAPPEADTVIFQVLDAMSEGRKAEALKLLSARLAKGVSPFYLLTMIAYQLRNLLLTKEVGEGRLSAKKAGLHPYILKKLSFSSRRFSKGELKKSLRRVFETDKDIKNGKINPEMGLELLVAEI